jgi:hypothetical protein
VVISKKTKNANANLIGFAIVYFCCEKIPYLTGLPKKLFYGKFENI